ncbi:FUSC family protein [Bacillus inaquosorum]|uniref:FUSC family protein n=1 Tax=Bacillus inaquosorum TaxID=483913 RepID=UPI00227F54D5|nr:FUSC family protein [Bacillus inaquosorum]MCY7943279.1 FUSC family protein [Bacillus inaquosorum]MCY7984476.1 FUSC family protein [Bacillus inaquosorum]MCY8245994.1 FUSC family protein [Bacillus inaquosorum]MCY8294995.1 FUSC family protein [Bacillus inaquosorum]MCY8708634.1 FUSC family protein [Bacillus inaquosorum]
MNKTVENNQRTMPSIVKDAFRIHANPFPWKKAIGSGIASGFPVLIGALAGHTDYGLTASIGGFVYLYAGGESYKKRALKLLLVSIGIALSFGLGTILSGTVWIMAAVLGLIGAAAMFIFSALGIQGPAPMFFVLAFLVSSGLPADPSQALFRSGLTFLGGIFAMGIALIGWLWNKHGPEEAVLQKTYHQLAACLSAVGTQGFHNAQHQTVLMLRTARQTVLGKGNRRKKSQHDERFFRLLEKADDIFLAIIHFSAEMPDRETAEIEKALRQTGDALGHARVSSVFQIKENESEPSRKLFEEINEALSIASGRNDKQSDGEPSRLPASFYFLRNAFDWQSPVLIRALKYGIVLFAADMFALTFGFERSYWIPLSAAAVMLGTTVLFTLHRAIQRSVGTVIGVGLAGAILFVKPGGVYIALCIAALQCLLEMLIVRNYALAVPFLTANALVITESMHGGSDVGYFMIARLTDVAVGSVIGLLGTMVLWRRFSTKRLPELMRDVIRLEGHFMEKLLTGQKADENKLRVSLVRLRDAYDKALGDFPNANADVLWPAISGAQHLGYYLLSAQAHHRPPAPFSEKEMNQLKVFFEQAEQTALMKRMPADIQVPHVPYYPRISKELSALYSGLRTAFEKRNNL